MTATTETAVKPAVRTAELGELIRAHRLYVGLSQRDMADRLKFDRRDYQRIESGRNNCPVGFLSKVEALTDEFDTAVDTIIEYAIEHGGVDIKIETEGWDWERNIAGRAAMLADADDEIPAIKLSTKGER